MNNKLPMLSSEVVHRVFEILKFFNTRTCQLVLGAGAMQVCLFGLSFVFSPNIYLFRGPFLSVFDRSNLWNIVMDTDTGY